MRLSFREVGYPHLLVAAPLVAMLIGAGVGVGIPSFAYGAFNTAWDGGSGVHGIMTDVGVGTGVIYNTTEYGMVSPALAGSVMFVISLGRGYADAEATHIEVFVRAGGTAVVVDDLRSHGNDPLVRLGTLARIDRTPFRNDRYQYKSGMLPVATHVTVDPLTRNVMQPSLNYPAMMAANESTTLTRSPNFSYLDRDDDGELDDDETP